MDDYCSIFDFVQQESLVIGKMITDSCLSGVVSRKTFIIPSQSKIDALGQFSGEELRKELMNYILTRACTYDACKKLPFIKTISGGTYNVSVVDDILHLNDVPVTLIRDHKRQAVFTSSGDLRPLAPLPAGRKKFTRKPAKKIEALDAGTKRVSRKSGLDIRYILF